MNGFVRQVLLNKCFTSTRSYTTVKIEGQISAKTQRINRRLIKIVFKTNDQTIKIGILDWITDK